MDSPAFAATGPRTIASKSALVAYFAALALLVARIAWLDEWRLAAFATLGAFVATAGREPRVPSTPRSLGLGIAFFAALCGAVAYLPEVWFRIAYFLNHAEHYVWNANAFMTTLPGNDGRFLWSHRAEPAVSVMRWVYLTGFDMVVWIPVVRSLVAQDPLKMARYALSAHIVQFPLIIPFYTAFRVDEVWSVLGHPDRCERGWSNEMRINIGANCFPSMHTSVAFAILLLSRREKDPVYRAMMAVYATSIIVSTVYMEIHWLIDVAGGLLLGLAAVKLTDRLIEWHLSRRAARSLAA